MVHSLRTERDLEAPFKKRVKTPKNPAVREIIAKNRKCELQGWGRGGVVILFVLYTGFRPLWKLCAAARNPGPDGGA
jgi:hypothetical protein